MKKKGFTIVELLAVLGVLAVLILIAIPAIDAMIKKNQTKLYNLQISNIKDAMKRWADGNTEMLPEVDSEITLTLGQLKSFGFIKKDLENPKTKKCFPNDLQLSINNNNNNYNYIVNEKSGSAPTNSDCQFPDDQVFMIMNGSYTITIPIGGTFSDPGVYVINEDGSNLTGNVIKKIYDSTNNEIASILTTVAGEYTIEYQITINSILYKSTRTVKVI